MFETKIRIKPNNPHSFVIICENGERKLLKNIISEVGTTNFIELNSFAEYKIQTEYPVTNAEPVAGFGNKDSIIEILKSDNSGLWGLVATILGGPINKVLKIARRGRVVAFEEENLKKEEYTRYKGNVATIQQAVSWEEYEGFGEILKEKGIETENIDKVSSQLDTEKKMYLNVYLKDGKRLLILPNQEDEEIVEQKEERVKKGILQI